MQRLTRRDLVEIFIAVALTIAALPLVVDYAVEAMEKHGGGVRVSDAWMRPTIGSNPNSAAYMTILNHGKADDKLLEVRGDVAKAIELHTHIRDGDVMRMRKVEGGLAVAAGKGLALQPGGHHVMLLGLTRKLAAGATIPLTLVFERAGEVKVDAKVQMKAAGGTQHGKHH
ncbi:MAG: copper chaperone PCu(A)C [Methyloligellaceae bacterium]